MNEKFLWRASCAGAENSSQIASVNTAYSCHILNRNIILEVLFDKIYRLFYIIITHFTGGGRLRSGNRLRKQIRKKIEMSHQMKRRLLWILRNVNQFIHHLFSCLPGVGHIDWRILGKATNVEDFCGTQPVKLHPDVFPWHLNICHISGDLSWKNHKSLSAPNLIIYILPLGIRGHQGACSGKNIVKKIVISRCRTK